MWFAKRGKKLAHDNEHVYENISLYALETLNQANVPGANASAAQQNVAKTEQQSSTASHRAMEGDEMRNSDHENSSGSEHNQNASVRAQAGEDSEQVHCYELADGAYEQFKGHDYEQTSDPYERVQEYEQQQASDPYDQIQSYERLQASDPYDQIQSYERLQASDPYDQIQSYERLQASDPYDQIQSYEQQQASGPYDQIQSYEQQQASGPYDQIQSYERLPVQASDHVEDNGQLQDSCPNDHV